MDALIDLWFASVQRHKAQRDAAREERKLKGQQQSLVQVVANPFFQKLNGGREFCFNDADGKMCLQGGFGKDWRVIQDGAMNGPWSHLKGHVQRIGFSMNSYNEGWVFFVHGARDCDLTERPKLAQKPESEHGPGLVFYDRDKRCDAIEKDGPEYHTKATALLQQVFRSSGVVGIVMHYVFPMLSL